MHDALDSLDERGPLGHNNLLPCVPELARLLDEPVIRGALTSILGPGYYLHFHRHDHFALNNEAQPLHKDGDNHSHNAVDGLRRIHRTRFAMLFYYPQDTPLAKGPTGIVPRSQYVPRRALEAARFRMNEFNNRLRKEIEAEIGESAFSPRGRELWRGTPQAVPRRESRNGGRFEGVGRAVGVRQDSAAGRSGNRRDRSLRHGARTLQRQHDRLEPPHGEVPVHPRPGAHGSELERERRTLASRRRPAGACLASHLGLAPRCRVGTMRVRPARWPSTPWTVPTTTPRWAPPTRWVPKPRTRDDGLDALVRPLPGRRCRTGESWRPTGLLPPARPACRGCSKHWRRRMPSWPRASSTYSATSGHRRHPRSPN